MLKVKQVAERLNLSAAKVYELLGAGRLPHYRLDGAIRVSEEQLKHYLEGAKRERDEVPAKKRQSRPQLRYMKL
jgi:excisionase family DNA binding protein